MMFNDFNDEHDFSSIKKHCQIYKQNLLNLPTPQCTFLSKRLLTHKIITSYIFLSYRCNNLNFCKKINEQNYICMCITSHSGTCSLKDISETKNIEVFFCSIYKMQDIMFPYIHTYLVLGRTLAFHRMVCNSFISLKQHFVLSSVKMHIESIYFEVVISCIFTYYFNEKSIIYVSLL